jgi:hypothetical protein
VQLTITGEDESGDIASFRMILASRPASEYLAAQYPRLPVTGEARFPCYHLTGPSWSDLVGVSCKPDIQEQPLV